MRFLQQHVHATCNMQHARIFGAPPRGGEGPRVIRLFLCSPWLELVMGWPWNLALTSFLWADKYIYIQEVFIPSRPRFFLGHPFYLAILLIHPSYLAILHTELSFLLDLSSYLAILPTWPPFFFGPHSIPLSNASSLATLLTWPSFLLSYTSCLATYLNWLSFLLSHASYLASLLTLLSSLLSTLLIWLSLLPTELPFLFG
jgi:hypothetical protein